MLEMNRISPEDKVYSWLRTKRLRAHAAIVGLCLWSIYIWTISTPGLRDRNGNLKGTDFLHLYTIGSLAAAHRGNDLYSMNAQAGLAAKLVPEAAGLCYLPLYPPQVSIFFVPLAYLSYAWALCIWWTCSAFIYGVCCYSLWRACPNLRSYPSTVALAAFAFPGFFHLIAWGQTSALALACFTFLFFCLRERREFLAGLVLGCLIFKPQLGLAAAFLFLAIGAWKTILGAVLSATLQLTAGVSYYGNEPLRRWIQILWNVRQVLPLVEPKPYQTHCLRTFWSMLVPWPGVSFALYLLCAIVVLALTISCWKRSPALALRYSALLFATVLAAPHLTIYDLVILVPGFVVAVDWLISQPHTATTRMLATLLYLGYMLPLIGPLARWTHIQFSVLAMSLTVFVIWKLSGTQMRDNAGIPAVETATMHQAL